MVNWIEMACEKAGKHGHKIQLSTEKKENGNTVVDLSVQDGFTWSAAYPCFMDSLVSVAYRLLLHYEGKC